MRVTPRNFFDLRARSLPRGNVLVVSSMVWAWLISGFPHIHSSWWLMLPALTTVAGTAETARCMQKEWNFYHGGVLLCVYMDLMVLTTIVFFLVYPLLPRLAM